MAKRQRVIAHIVVHIAQNAVEVPAEGWLVYVTGQLLRPFHRQHRLMRLLIPVQDDAMVEQGYQNTSLVVIYLKLNYRSKTV